jgi:hypothetical protein
MQHVSNKRFFCFKYQDIAERTCIIDPVAVISDYNQWQTLGDRNSSLIFLLKVL